MSKEKIKTLNTYIITASFHGINKSISDEVARAKKAEGVNGILPSDHYFVMADVKVGD